MALPMASLIAAGAGVFCHHAYFIRGEHLTDIPVILRYVALLLVIGIATLTLTTRLSLLDSGLFFARLCAAFLAGSWTSVLIYRAFFHRLGRFPGPFAARLSQFYHSWSVRRLDQYRWLDDLHKTYGPVVRIGESHPMRFDGCLQIVRT
jgi:hypothetical protein